MTDFRVGYLYSLAPIHCGGEGDLGNILEIAREVHTDFPYVPGSSLRGGLRNEVQQLDETAANILFGKELDDDGQMGVHQVWFGDARLLWIPMRTMSSQAGDVFTWVSCHTLIRDHAILTGNSPVLFPSKPVGTKTGRYEVADAQIEVSKLDEGQKQAINLAGNWPSALSSAVQPTWSNNRLVLPDNDFQVLMEHSLWTQIRNKIQEDNDGAGTAGSAEIFWTDVCIPRDTILYYPWGYRLLKDTTLTTAHHDLLMDILTGLIQVGGQANVGRGWAHSWVTNTDSPVTNTQQTATVGG
ncbi:type III-B CRISPR module RAMP protein Cmr4 [Spirulina subsalsa FACHB-351]|uniref:Type III-B CRISPR module RAMP protein Cmr4 n=1 Tax=Spirulina subsalsa FACHB-351 TaxID=234711 RepID=A0ABT3LBJ3_9CYAN|nr:RAMP superfamily CRISPR-associated protein [Spirulina subsalsa]MCW6038868.1 type III-B CRISPR module RAMP protein Cmr4 [Spirulina subsalsa FACHB-351]